MLKGWERFVMLLIEDYSKEYMDYLDNLVTYFLLIRSRFYHIIATLDFRWTLVISNLALSIIT